MKIKTKLGWSSVKTGRVSMVVPRHIESIELKLPVCRDHYPDDCRLCNSPAYIGAGFTSPECSNDECEYYGG